MPHGDCVVRDEFILRCGHPMNWMEMVHELPADEASLAHAFSAWTISRVGKENGDGRLVRESTKIYGQALKDMQMALYDPTRMHSDEVLVASMLLGLYEVFEGSTLDSRSWLSHAQGAARLIEFRGPERHKNRQAHHAFLGSRVPTVYAAMLSRKATYLSTEEWRAIPWETQHRTYFDRLVDTATLAPGLLEKVDEANADVSNLLTCAHKRRLLQDLAGVQRSLETWKRHVKKEGMAHIMKHKHKAEDRYPFENEIWFENHPFSNAHSVYWASSLVIAETAEELIADLQSYDTEMDLVELDSMKTLFNSRRHATCIAKAIPYCLQPDMGALGACMINFPANLALRFFRRARDIPVVHWLSRVFKDMCNRGLQRNPQIMQNGSCNTRDTSPTLKSESSESDGSEEGTPSSVGIPTGTVLLKFVSEDPSRLYTDDNSEYG